MALPVHSSLVALLLMLVLGTQLCDGVTDDTSYDHDFKATV